MPGSVGEGQGNSGNKINLALLSNKFESDETPALAIRNLVLLSSLTFSFY